MSKSIRNRSPLDRLRGVLYDGSDATAGNPPTSVTGPLGTVPGAGIDTDRPVAAPRQPSPRQQEMIMQAELVAAVRSLAETNTQISAQLGRRGALNGVLDVWAGVLPAGGTITRNYEVVVGSMRVTNHGAAILTVQSGVAAGDTGAQSAGTGVQYVGPGATHSFPVGDRGWTITGTAADKVSIQAYTGLQALGVSGL